VERDPALHGEIRGESLRLLRRSRCAASGRAREEFEEYVGDLLDRRSTSEFTRREGDAELRLDLVYELEGHERVDSKLGERTVHVEPGGRGS
jgi:hypothetical protein